MQTLVLFCKRFTFKHLQTYFSVTKLNFPREVKKSRCLPICEWKHWKVFVHLNRKHAAFDHLSSLLQNNIHKETLNACKMLIHFPATWHKIVIAFHATQFYIMQLISLFFSIGADLKISVKRFEWHGTIRVFP